MIGKLMLASVVGLSMAMSAFAGGGHHGHCGPHRPGPRFGLMFAPPPVVVAPPVYPYPYPYPAYGYPVYPAPMYAPAGVGLHTRSFSFFFGR